MCHDLSPRDTARHGFSTHSTVEPGVPQNRTRKQSFKTANLWGTQRCATGNTDRCHQDTAMRRMRANDEWERKQSARAPYRPEMDENRNNRIGVSHGIGCPQDHQRDHAEGEEDHSPALPFLCNATVAAREGTGPGQLQMARYGLLVVFATFGFLQ